MGTETGYLRRKHREAIKLAYPDAIIVSQPASAETGPGRTDFYVVVFGRYIGLEIKTSTGRATPIQLAKIQRIRRAGGWAAVVRHPDESLALIKYALQGGNVWDNLFDEETPGSLEPKSEIRAFPSADAVEAASNLNGAVVGHDGATQEPPADYPFAVIIQRLDRNYLAIKAFAQGAGVDLEEAMESMAPTQVVEPQAEPPAPPRRRSRKKAE